MGKKPKYDWYLRAWIEALNIPFPHPWLQKELGYSDGKASNVLTGKKRYDRDIINEVADALKVQPYELLMHPADAFALRRLRETAAQIVHDSEKKPDDQPALLTTRKKSA